MPNDRKLHTPAYTSTPRLRSLCMTYFVRSGHFVLFVLFVSFVHFIQSIHFVYSAHSALFPRPSFCVLRVLRGLFRQRWILFVFPSAKTKSRT
jgi:hypothetical protein